MKRKQEIQIIEKTGKFFKFIKLIGFLMAIVSAPIACAGNTELAVVLAPIGIVIFLVGKILAWWFHG